MDSPLWFDVGDGPDVVLGGEHELGVEDPLGLVVEARRRVDLHDLVVLHRQVVTRPLQVRDLAAGNEHKQFKTFTVDPDLY